MILLLKGLGASQGTVKGKAVLFNSGDDASLFKINNQSMEIEDAKLREKISGIVNKIVQWNE